MLLAFEGRQRELQLIGKILLSYGELEFILLDTLGSVLKSRTHAVRTMYQVRSEVSRLTIFEAIATPFFEDVKLGGQLKEALDAMGHCKNIRNQYAHCTWMSKPERLTFANLEEPAKSKGPSAIIVFRPLTIRLLREQWEYLQYTDRLLIWLNQQYRRKTKRPLEGPITPKPRRVSPPKRSSRGEPLPLLSQCLGRWRFPGPLPQIRLDPNLFGKTRRTPGRTVRPQ